METISVNVALMSVGVTAYLGGAGLIQNPDYLQTAASALHALPTTESLDHTHMFALLQVLRINLFMFSLLIRRL